MTIDMASQGQLAAFSEEVLDNVPVQRAPAATNQQRRDVLSVE
jgi:hypothetical protein